MSDDIAGKNLEVEMRSGAKAIRDAISGVMIDVVNVVSADFVASNSTIHVIDA